MKKIGNTSDFISDRNRELHRRFMDVLKNSSCLSLRDMYGAAAKKPASRFWVSESRAAIVVGAMMRGRNLDKMYAKRREMFQEIFRRVNDKMQADPSLCMTHAVDIVVNEPAPEFYLTSESARSIIYRMRQRKKKQSINISKFIRHDS